jgi:hypothetical protein
VDHEHHLEAACRRAAHRGIEHRPVIRGVSGVRRVGGLARRDSPPFGLEGDDVRPGLHRSIERHVALGGILGMEGRVPDSQLEPSLSGAGLTGQRSREEQERRGQAEDVDAEEGVAAGSRAG